MAALKKPDIPLTGVINYLGGYTHKPQPQQTPYARREVCPEQEQAYWDTRRRIEREEAERAEKSKNAPPLTVEEMQRLRKQMKAGAKNLSGDNGKA